MYPLEKVFEFTYVWLKRNIESPHLFRCPQCGSPVMKYQGQATAIIPAGSEGLGTAAAMNITTFSLMNFPIETKCSNKNCPAKYIFEGMTV